MAINCPYCGRVTLPGAKFCSSCGSTLGQGAQPAQQSTPVWQGNTYTVVQPAGTNSNSRKKPGQTILAVALSAVLVVETCVAGFKYPGFFRTKKGAESVEPENTRIADVNDTEPQNTLQDIGYYGITQEELDAYLADPIEPTVENSPGNPAFIDISFTQEEYDSAKTLTAPVSREDPTADFPEFDMHVDLKWWNLENDEDTLIVKQMPAKTCPVTGVEIYSYDYSLASGQNEFPTEVEITAPILGDPDIFTGVLHQNEETGKWEEDCFTISEDGKYYTAYMSHFSGDGPVYDKSGLEKMKQQGIEATNYYQEDGKCLFRIMPYQDEAKYPGSNTWLYGIGLVKMPDFERFVSQDDKYAQKILDDMLNKTGGVPAEAGLAEAYSAIGAENDKYSAVMAGLDPGVQKLIEKYSKSSAFKEAASKVSTGISTIMWGFGTDVLGMRMIDQYERGVSTKKIVKSNAVGVISAVVGAVGTGASLLGEATVTIAPAVSLACSAVCAGIYIGGEIKASADAKFKKDFPLGYGDTLEKYAYIHYLSYYEGNSAMGIESPRYLLRKVVNENPPPDGSINSSAYDKPININGDGWSNALRLIFTHYKSDPVKMAQVTDKLINEYEACIERFWDSAHSMLRDSCWRESCIKMLSPTAAPELRVDDSWWEDSVYGSKLTNSKSVTKHKADVRAFAAKYQLPLSQAWRSHDLANWADSYFGAVPTGAQWGEAWYYGDPKTYRDYSGEFFDPSADSDSEYAASSTFYPNRIETGFVNYVSDFEYFDEITEEEIKQLKEHALNSFHENINPIVYSYQQHFRNKCIKDLRNRLYDEVLPWLNTRVTFYMKDTSLPEGSRQSDSLYTDFEFVCDKHAYFNPSLMEKDDASAAYLGYGLYLKRSMTESADGMISTLASSPVLLETNVYHYLRYGCPTEVNIKALDRSIPAVKGAADWTGIELKTDPGSMYNALPKDKQIDGMFLDAGDLNAFYKPIKDLKVPIVYTGQAKTPSTSATLHLTELNSETINGNNTVVNISVSSDGTVELAIPSCSWSESGGIEVGSNSDTTYAMGGFTIRGKRVKSSDEIVNSDGSGCWYALMTSVPPNVTITSEYQGTTQEYYEPGEYVTEGWVTKPFIIQTTKKLTDIKLPSEEKSYNDTKFKIEYDQNGEIIGGHIMLDGKEIYSLSDNGNQTSYNEWDTRWIFKFSKEKPV